MGRNFLLENGQQALLKNEREEYMTKKRNTIFLNKESCGNRVIGNNGGVLIDFGITWIFLVNQEDKRGKHSKQETFL